LTRPEIEAAALKSYRHERRTNFGVPVVSALMEGGFIGVIADKVYHVHPSVLALISAAPMFGLLSSFVWARLAQGRPKVPWITSLMVLFVAAAAAIAALPEGRFGAWLLVASMISARLLLGGIITIRSLVWTLNYPREARARVTSRLQFITILTMTTTSLAGAAFLDAEPESFRIVYGVGALLGAAGALSFSRVRVIGERAHLSLERVEPADAEEAQVPLDSAWSVLRADPMFRRYQACQFLLGVSNMMIEAPLIYLVSRELQASYTTSIALTLAIPLGLSLFTLPLWATYFDRVHIAEFRARHSWIWVVAQAITWVGAMQGSLLWIGLGRVLLGIGRGGGTLAWQLGHNDFARPENVGLYMGIHVTLTGIRGAFAPFMGMLLYVGWGAFDLPALSISLPAFDGLGGHAIGLACLLGAVGALGYWRLHRQIAGASG
jgi:MFS family permease